MANALIDAVKENDVVSVKQLIERGVDIDGVDGMEGLLCGGQRREDLLSVQNCCWRPTQMWKRLMALNGPRCMMRRARDMWSV